MSYCATVWSSTLKTEKACTRHQPVVLRDATEEQENQKNMESSERGPISCLGLWYVRVHKSFVPVAWVSHLHLLS